MAKIPNRWLSYSPMGEPIPGTRFISFKVPLKHTLCKSLHDSERFTPEMLMEQCPKLGLVVDLTNTSRYYNGEVFKSKGIQYKKIYCPGQVVPADSILKEFFSTVDAFLNESVEHDSLVGVHCTHGLNRTGYFICSI
ncbi:RNA/RNP complex-1-interacting phosphatase isoform X6 [Cryptotermes secundus]|uniref:RNA/RNP complex-1-interacting phosphatase isoform X6 n=1 Tax=Cryptotermes secundus TaxID=105785 RepID=UPI001454C7C3|nr:RNA/RNP complex-1-interacting phosphatase isoform X6 [Cryptotermes secundus]